MAHVGNIGTRIELVSMDRHFDQISIGLYEQADADGAPCFVVHTYSHREGSAGRVERIVEAMRVLGGMQVATKGAPALRFACGHAHRAACRRAFLEACRLEPQAALAAAPLHVFDKKSDANVEAVRDGSYYTIVPVDDDANRVKRAQAVARGLVKLAQMEPVNGSEDRVAFPCGQAHDALVGLLLGRAINVRAALRESEATAGRGVLAAPSAQRT